MKRTLALGPILYCCVAFGAVAGPPPPIVFERGPAIWMAHLDGSNAHQITKGTGPDLSPDGTRIAFNTDDTSAKDLVREIAIADVATRKVTVVKGVPSKNCQRALWSPDGKQILFNIFNGNDWDLALIGAEGSGFRIFKKAGPDHHSLWSTSWAADGKSIFAQDLDYIYQFNLDGREVKKWKLDTIFPKGGMNSGAKLASSPDGKRLLVEVDMEEEETNMPDWDGPPPSLWIFELESARAVRLTNKGMVASSGCWLDKSRILFNLHSAKEKEPAIYEMDVEKKELKPVIKNGMNPAVARGAGG